MPATFIHDDDCIDHIPSTDLPAGAVVVLGALIGITARPIPALSLGSLAVEGVFDLPVIPGGTAVPGTTVFWEPGSAQATTNPVLAPTGLRAGTLVRPLAAADAAARVLINR
ncbi:MAG: DUF2190 family protein [Planctomycetes bacterium]|nr:DUF2190 family protein [Planctomycetota bacterium]